MFGIALTGGIGSGKSSVSDRLVARGAELIDADQIAREVERPGGAAYDPLVDRFGEAIRAPDGNIDRPALAKIVFTDAEALADLNAITHPAIGARMGQLGEALSHTDSVVVFAIPLLRSVHRELLGFDAVVVVDCPTEIALERLVEGRGMSREDALARMSNQVTRAERLQLADYVVDNSVSLEDLEIEVASLWAWIEERRTPPPE